MREFRVFMDGILLKNLPGGLDDFSTTLIRESGLSNEEQIFRQKSEAELTFYGDGKDIICKKREEVGYCGEIAVVIQHRCSNADPWQTIFEGTYQDKLAKVVPAKCLITSQLYDNSFSAKIKNRQKNKVFLNATKSASGVTIPSALYNDVYFYEPIGLPLPTGRRVWQVYEVFKLLISYLSDNTIGVVSDYFTTGEDLNKWAILTGTMLRKGVSASPEIGTSSNMYVPEISYQEFLLELRKKLRIYTAVENDSTGKIVIRIEPEEYFFQNNVIINIEKIPLNLDETFEEAELFSEVKVGASENQVDNEYYHPRVRLTAWEDETYNNCSNCAIENTLDLVSNWIIDSNVIYDIIDGNDAFDKEIVLIELDTVATPGTFTKISPTSGNAGKYHYNESLKNYAVLNRWGGGTPECIKNFFDTEPCMVANVENDYILHHDASSGNINVSDIILYFSDEDCDSALAHDGSYGGLNVKIPENFFPPVKDILYNNDGQGSIYVCPIGGNYKFELQVEATNILTNIPGGNNIGPLEEYKIEAKILVFNGGIIDIESGNIITPDFEFIDTFFITGTFDNPVTHNFAVTTSLMNLPTGAVVMPIFRIRTHKNGLNLGDNDTIRIDSGTFKLLEADYNELNQLIMSEGNRPIKWEFDLPISASQFQTIKSNPYGIIRIDNKEGWIKELKFFPDKLSKVITIGRESLLC